MGIEIDLLKNYPKSKRNVDDRGKQKTDKDRLIAKRFGKEFFDGDRRHGYGGFKYNSRFWKPVIPDLQKFYGLNSKSSVLDVGCAKGFMLYDMYEDIRGIRIRGVDISEYAIENSHPEIREFLSVANAKSLPFKDNSFDLVISINTIHNLKKDDCKIALKEIERVSRGKSFITVDAYRNDREKELMNNWNLTAETFMHVDGWVEFFKSAGYTGDYYWFIP